MEIKTNKMKLEFKKIVGYSPYKVKLMMYGLACELEGFDLHKKDTVIAERVNYDFDEIKLILHPLSDLTKEIEIGGEKFVPITRLRPDSFNSEGKFSYDYYKQARVFILKNNDTGEELHIYTTNFISVSTRKHIFNVSDYRIIQKLYEWHFDIHNLIDEGLAIDINTL